MGLLIIDLISGGAEMVCLSLQKTCDRASLSQCHEYENVGVEDKVNI